MKPHLGDVIADKYRLDRVLGEGGMSTVYAATNTLTGKAVAIKWLHPDVTQDDEQCQRLLREAQATSAIDHPNVVNVFDVGRHEGAMFLVMELLHGEPLAALLTRREETQPFSPSEFVQLMLPVLRGVAAAHRRGVVHRDLKPDNIFLCRDPDSGELRQPKVLDFGISKLTHQQGELNDELTREGTVFGTPQYMAPEQMRDARVADVRSDIYALGVIFYRALAKQYPHDADTLTALAIRIVEGNPLALYELCPNVDVTLSDAVMRALAVEPEHRFQSVAAFAQALEPHAFAREITRPLEFGDDDDIDGEVTTVLHVSDLPLERERAPVQREGAEPITATLPRASDVVPGKDWSEPTREAKRAGLGWPRTRMRRSLVIVAVLFPIGLLAPLAYRQLAHSGAAPEVRPSGATPTHAATANGAHPGSVAHAEVAPPERLSIFPQSPPPVVTSPLDAAVEAPPPVPPTRAAGAEKRRRPIRPDASVEAVESGLVVDDLRPIQAERNPYLRR